MRRKIAIRILDDLWAICCWPVLCWISVKLGMALGQPVMDPQGRDPAGYLILVMYYGVFVFPVAFASSTYLFLFWKKRHVWLFIASAMPIGLAIALWPLVFLWTN